MQTIKNSIPWWGIIATKIVLSRLPVSHKVWKKLSLFEAGHMEQPSYAYGVFKHHFEQFKQHDNSSEFCDRREQNSGQGFVGLELGSGDSLFSAMISSAFGSSTSYLVDVGDFASKDIQQYRAMADFLTQKELPAPNMQNLHSLEEILACCSGRYLTSGLSSVQTIPDRSVDFVWSHSVLQHIRLAEFLETIRELRRIIRDRGVCSHVVDLRDMLGGALNHLRFPKRLWESDFMARSGFYSNRIRYSQMLDLFQQAGFDVEVIEVNRWTELPTPRSKLSEEFAHFPDEDLCVSGFHVILKPIRS